MRVPLLVLFACPGLLAAPLERGTPLFSLRMEGLVGQPTTRLSARAGGALGVAVRLTDQLAAIGDVGTRAAPRGPLTTIALGLSATIDATPVAPFVELSVVQIGPRGTAAYSLATRTAFGADWSFARGLAIGLVVRQFLAFDPVVDGDAPGGTEAAIRFVYTPGGK